MKEEIQHLEAIQSKGFLGRLLGYGKMTGPGWLQAAVTLGGGSLAGALYLGVVAGYSLMWLQPLAMICGVIMLIALSHVTLSNKEYPFNNVKKAISPTLAWGWLGATVIANVVFCTAQASLGVATAQQNLGLGSVSPYVITLALALIAFGSGTLYALGSQAIKRLETVLKLLVAMVMISFAAAAGFLLFSGKIDIGAVLMGLIPNPKSLFTPAASLDSLITATGSSADYWSNYIADTQRSRIIAAFGSAVGINMTFLLPYTLVKRGWTKSHRELSRFDLVIALFTPFAIATALLVICAAASFHAQTDDVLDEFGQPRAALEGGYYKILDQRLALEADLPADITERRVLANALPEADRMLAAALTNRDAKQLATTLAPLMGERVANIVFGLGILAMALSTMMVHALMNGFAISQAVGKPGKAAPFVVGAAMPALLAIFAPLAWTGDAKTALVIPAVVIANLFLPIAYLAILLLINSPQVIEKKDRPSSLINILLIFSASVATCGSVWTLWHKGTPGMIGISGLVVISLIGIVGYKKNSASAN
ncbi:divalent metal cation transporter [Puniceicoccaceae bacterium K14]|nr:divalent metal cation transporter [Puniceicoccaceae bacterium K14]